MHLRAPRLGRTEPGRRGDYTVSITVLHCRLLSLSLTVSLAASHRVSLSLTVSTPSLTVYNRLSQSLTVSHSLSPSLTVSN
eukprot:7780853-Pyramimonas_sp.AAC.1